MDLDLEEVINGYAQGYFLMADTRQSPLAWYTTHERTIIPLDERFRYPRSLKRVLNQNQFTTAINQDFSSVVDGCADRASTWISQDLKRLYLRLNQAGWAFSFETWRGDELAGGVLGIVLGRTFIGESMFFRISEGSKVAVVKLVEHLRKREFTLFDAQMPNPHLARFGAYDIPQADYLSQLQSGLQRPCRFI
ncbi:MAG: leucyl/phenylalanyl-tRNA--protein transferase [Cyanobacteria bacterium P01_F01_bin.42]